MDCSFVGSILESPILGNYHIESFSFHHPCTGDVKSVLQRNKFLYTEKEALAAGRGRSACLILV